MARPSVSRLAPALVVLASVGCATAGGVMPATRPVSAPAWHSTAQGVVPHTRGDFSRWWEQLGDTTLTALIDRALANSPDVRVAQARLRQVRALRGQAEAALWPRVTVSGSGGVRGTATRTGAADGSTGTVTDASGSLGASLDASWEPDVFGGTRRGIDAATEDVRASIADLQATYVSLAAEVARTYGELRTLQARLGIARRNEASQAETLELTEFRAQAGLVGSIDVEQARASVEQTRAQMPALESAIAQATFQLATLAGAEPASMTAALSVAAPLPGVPAEVAVGIPADVLRQRPDLRAAEARILAETARLDQARSERHPQFTLSGSLGVEVLKGAATGGTSLVSSLAGGLLQTLFDRGRIGQQIEAQSAAQAQAIASYEATLLAALRDVEQALVAFDRNRERLASLRAATDAAQTAELLARSQYAAGLTDFQTVLSTQRTVLAVQESAAITAGDRLTALVQLYKALGGGWPATAATPAQDKTTS